MELITWLRIQLLEIGGDRAFWKSGKRSFSDFFNVAASRPAKSPPAEFRDWQSCGQSVLICLLQDGQRHPLIL
jgi:hypothetical protein